MRRTRCRWRRLGGEGGKGSERGGFIEERHVQRIEREVEGTRYEVRGTSTAGGRDRGQRGNNRVAWRPSAAGCPWRLIASLQRRMTSRDATALDRSSPGRASWRPFSPATTASSSILTPSRHHHRHPLRRCRNPNGGSYPWNPTDTCTACVCTSYVRSLQIIPLSATCNQGCKRTTKIVHSLRIFSTLRSSDVITFNHSQCLIRRRDRTGWRKLQ